ncbi:response regulator [Flavobacterium sp.]|uniref:response regulator n=1 Tax=Flavobacterium sp. TaxID=239 RepID=UPI002488BEC3|nr:response regulator [Flavobacterium sp.]MDI1317747.1 response regulator [Flavobacterium sp.]
MKLDKIMLIDDDKIFNYLHTKILEKINSNYEIISYESPFEAFRYLINLAIIDIPSVIFLDINMPELNGFELIDKIKKEKKEVLKHLNIVIVTSSLNPYDYEIHKQYDVIKAFCNKPLNLEKSQSIINSLLIKN